MLLKCRKCRQRDLAFESVKGLCPECQHAADMAKPPHRRGRNDKAVLLIQSKVSPGRVPMTGYLILFLGVAAAAIGVELLRFFAELTRARQLGAAAAGSSDFDLGALHSADSTLNTTIVFRFIAFLAVMIAYQRWARVGHANAMTRPDIGLGWIRALPGGTGVVWTYMLWFMSVFAMLFFSLANGSADNVDSLSRYQSLAHVDAVYCVVRLVVAVLLCVFVVQLHIGLNKLLATPAPLAFSAPGQFGTPAPYGVPTQYGAPQPYGVPGQMPAPQVRPLIIDAAPVTDAVPDAPPATEPASDLT